MNDVKIALISATPLAIAPATAAVGAAIPDSVVWNLLDDRLLVDLQQQGSITTALAARMDALIAAALAGGADGVLLTCSQYGSRADGRDPVSDGATVLSADGPLFEATAALAPSGVLLVASLESAAADSSVRLQAVLKDTGVSAEIHSLVVASAASQMSAEELTVLLANAIEGVREPYDVVVLAQYSLAPAAESLRLRIAAPVLDGPSTAADRLRNVIQGELR